MMNAVLMLHHPAWQPGQAEMAAGGGADRRSAQIAAAPVPRESHALGGASEPDTDGVALKAPLEAKGLPQSKHGHVLNALTCRFAPLAGLEPAPYGLEDRRG